jgi:hypothetical protein
VVEIEKKAELDIKTCGESDEDIASLRKKRNKIISSEEDEEEEEEEDKRRSRDSMNPISA